MTNVNAPAQLAAHAAEHGINLMPYRRTLADLQAMGVFIDPEPPFADAVLIRLRLGHTIETAVSEARAEALATLDQ